MLQKQFWYTASNKYKQRTKENNARFGLNFYE